MSSHKETAGAGKVGSPALPARDDGSRLLSPDRLRRGERSRSAVPVVYIAGFGRSGSTLLDRLMGSGPGLHSGGELSGFWRQGLIEDRLCSCGVRFSGCSFWRAVNRDSFSLLSTDEIDKIVQYMREVFPARKIWRIFGRRTRRNVVNAAPEIFWDVNARLYRQLREVSAQQVVVDSSKLATYLVMLAHVPSVDLHVVHLLRDPRAVAHSWQRPW